MKFKAVIVLLLVGAGAWFAIDRYLAARRDWPEAAPDMRRLFATAKVEEVFSLAIESEGTSKVILRRDAEGAWRMSQPVESAAESEQVDALLADLLVLESMSQHEVAGKGLDKPRFHIQLTAKGGKFMDLRVGDRNAGGGMYVQVRGKPKADLVSAAVWDRLSRPTSELRDRRLVTTRPAQIRQLLIETDGQRLVLGRRENNWQVVEPEVLPADGAVVGQLLAAVTDLRAIDWIPKDAPEVASVSFEEARLRVSFTTEAPAASTQPVVATPQWTTIAFGNAPAVGEKVYAKIMNSGVMVKVNASVVRALARKAPDLRDRDLVDINPKWVNSLRITRLSGQSSSTKHSVRPTTSATTQGSGKGVEVVIERSRPLSTRPTTSTAPSTIRSEEAAADWVLGGAVKGDAEDAAVWELLGAIHPLRVDRYLDSLPQTLPSKGYELTVDLRGPEGPSTIQLGFLDPGGDRPLIGQYNGLIFETDVLFKSRLEADFVRKPTTRPSGK